MKDIKDYLHLYLGCEAVIGKHSEIDGGRDLIAIMVGYDTKNKGTVTCLYYEHGVETKCIAPTSIKPILRPLADMTDKEKTLGDIHNYPPWDASEFKWLLSEGFDLFNLIPEGLAIDKTTNKNEYYEYV